MAWYHVNNCTCPVGCCDCGTPSEDRVKLFTGQIVLKEDTSSCNDCRKIVMREEVHEGYCFYCWAGDTINDF